MKASGITKCSNKKWSGNFSGEHSTPGTNASRSSRPIIQVNEEIHFLVDSNGVNNISTMVPNEKSIELSRKTYSKKNPIMRPLTEHGVSTFAIHHLPVKSKTRPSTPVDSLPRKRKSQNNSSPIPTKLTKRNLQSKDSAPQSCPAKILRPSRNRSAPPTPSDSDSDVEIVAVKLFQPVTVQVSKATDSRTRKLQASAQNGKKKSFGPESNHGEVLMNEADIAPAMAADLFSEGRSLSGTLRWLSANGTISVPAAAGNSGNAASGNSGNAAPGNSGNAVPPPQKTSVQRQQPVPGAKQSPEKSSKKSRELENLYKNLDEIAWAHDSSFKNLLRNPDYSRHSERSVGRVVGTGKNLRKLNEKKAVTSTPKDVRPKNKMAQMNENIKSKPFSKAGLVKTVQGKGAKKATPLTNGIKRKTELKVKTLKLKKEEEEEDDDNVYYMLPPDAPQPKPAPPKEKPTLLKAKPPKAKAKSDNMPKIKTESSKPKSTVLKLKPDGPSRSKSNGFKLSPDTARGKPDIKKLKSFVPIKKPIESPPSTSGLQKMAGSSTTTTSSSSSSSSRCLPGSSHSNPQYSKSPGNFHFSKDMHMLHGYLDKNEEVYSAYQNASKLRVRLQPLEQTDLWTSEFYEEFRKHFLDQALKRAVETRDNDSSNIMYQELLDSFMSSQNVGGVNGGSSRVLKRNNKRPEEEALRSSVRQSEGAFRYKEIVVKKHPNYMQVVLVPNESKQNSLTLEAMKELKEAFLLAKKDPNCRAVLLNSSGPYFCTGIDLAPLVGNNKKQAAEDISNSIRDLVMTLSMFTKPVVAAVNGAALGFGVSLLTYCDCVLASDKATFCLPAAKIGYIPEGGITYTLPQVVGSSVASEMFMQGRRITAEQACRYGLVSEVIWPTRLMNEVIPRLQTIISQPLVAMEATKTMVRCNLWDKLKSHVDRERRLLCEHWLSNFCQSNIKTLLQTGWLLD